MKRKAKIIFSAIAAIILSCILAISISASEESNIAYRYTKGGVTVEAEHVDGTMDLSHVVTDADSGTTIYVLKDIEMANGPTSQDAVIKMKKNVTVDLGGHTLSIKQNAKTFIKVYANVTATWKNGTIVTSKTTSDTEAHPIFRSDSQSNPTLNLVNINSYTGGLIGSYSGQSIKVNITGGEHHIVLESDLHFNSILHARGGTTLTATDATFYVGKYQLLTALSYNTTDGNPNHSYTFTNCNIIADSAETNIIGESNENVTVSFTGCSIVGSMKPTLHSWDSNKGYAEMKAGSITLGKDTVLASGATIKSGLATYPDGYSLLDISEKKEFTLALSSGKVYDGSFAIGSAKKSFTFSKKVLPSDDAPRDTQILIDLNTEWKYLDNNTDPADGLGSLTAWTLPEFDDSGWKTGIGSFGAKSGELGPTNGKTPNVLLTQYIEGTTTCIPTYFFRTEINIEDIDEIAYFALNANADDGVVVYINGKAILDTRTETISKTTNMKYYSGVWENSLTIPINELGGALKEGKNTVAIQLHNNQSGSSDLYLGVNEFSVHYGDVKIIPAMQVVLGMGSSETERSVSWISNSPLDTQLRLAKKSDVINGIFPSEYKSFTATSVATTNKTGYFAKDAVITGLTPATKYAYCIVTGEETSEIYYFETGKSGDYSFTFVGDPQISTSAHGTAWGDTLDKITANFDSDFLISAGDQISSPQDEDQYTYFIKDALSEMAFAPTIGPVHDDPSKSFSDHFYTPNASDKYGVSTAGSNYWYTYNNTLFMHLNMADTGAYKTEHRAFIEEAMAKNPDVTWNIVVMHSSLFSTGMHGDPNYSYFDSEIGLYREPMTEMFTEFEIDLVISGHDHVYVRTHMMTNDGISADTVTNNSVTNPEGTLYVCASSSTGSKFYDQYLANAEFVAFEDYTKRKSALKFEVTDNHISFKAYYLDDMTVFDSFTIYREEEKTVTATWTAADGTVLGTSEVVLGATAKVPKNLKAAGSLVPGWLDYIPAEWNESLYVPEDATEVTFTEKVGGAKTPIAAVKLLFNINLATHFEYHLFVPVAAEGITVTAVDLRGDRLTRYNSFINTVYMISGERYTLVDAWPGLYNAVKESSSVGITFTYGGKTYSVSKSINMVTYCDYILTSGLYSDAAMDIAANAANYIVCGNTILNTSGDGMNKLRELVANNTSRIISIDKSAASLPSSSNAAKYISGVQLTVVEYGPKFRFILTDAGKAASKIKLSTGLSDLTDTEKTLYGTGDAGQKAKWQAVGYVETTNTTIAKINKTTVTVTPSGSSDVAVTYSLANYYAALLNTFNADGTLTADESNILLFADAMYGYAISGERY